MWSSVYKVRVSHERSAEAYDRAIECCDQDLSMGVEGVCDVQVVGDECLERVFELIFLCAWGFPCDLYVCASIRRGIGQLYLLSAGVRGGAYALKKRPVPVRSVTWMSSRVSMWRSHWAMLKYWSWLRAPSFLGWLIVTIATRLRNSHLIPSIALGAAFMVGSV